MSVRTWLHTTRALPRLVVPALAVVALVFGFAPAASADPVDQTITFSSPPSPARYGGTYQVTATATSGLLVTIEVDSSTSGNCTYDGTTVTFIHVGTCQLNASVPGNGSYNPATGTQTFTIDPHPLTVPVGAVQNYGTAT